MSGRVEGVWHPPGSSRATPAVLRIAGRATCHALSDGSLLTSDVPLTTVTISDRVGSIPRRITFPDGSLFETDDNDGIDSLVAAHGRSKLFNAHELERFRPRLALFVALIVLLGIGIYRYGVPVLVEVAVAMTPPVVPQLMSKGVLASLDSSVFSPSGLEPARRDAISADFRELAELAKTRHGGGQDYTLHFRDGGLIGPNAFALPDGTIVLTDELVELANDDEMVMGVLGHEIGHVDREHSLRQLYRAAGVSALIMIIGGDIGAGAEDILVQGTALLSLSHSRAAEREADRYSVDLMHAAGRDPAAIVRFFELMQTRFGDTSDNDFLSTHPATPSRIEETRLYAEEVAARGD